MTASLSPTISVIMPVYNTPTDFLRDAIDSILGQTFTDFEFIIIDDGSTMPDVKQTILSYHDERIRYVYKENSGITKTLLHGLTLARGEFIARMDSDDISMPERFATQVEFLRNNPDISIVGAFLETFPRSHIITYPSRPTIMDMYTGPKIGHPVAMWRRADFEKYGLQYDPQYPFAQDYELWSRAIRYVKFANIKTVLLKYRDADHNVSHTHRTQQRAIADHVQQTILDFLTTDKTLQSKIHNIFYPTTAQQHSAAHKKSNTPTTKKTVTYVKLFNRIPLLKIKKGHIYLLGCIKCLSIKNKIS